MTPLIKIAGFAALLVGVFAAAALLGRVVEPQTGTADEPKHTEEKMNSSTQTAEAPSGHTAPADPTAALPGLAMAEAGYRLVAEATRFEAGVAKPYGFRIVDEGGETVRSFDVEHDRPMHLIVVRRDMEGFQHLHPRQRADGSWITELELPAAGTYRAFADFSTAGRSLTLGADLFAPGEFEPAAPRPPSSRSAAGDGYEVTMRSQRPMPEAATPVSFAVSRDGRQVDAVEPYLGADGHLVALREGDLAFLHTHPEGEPGGGGPISFGVEYPSAGRYRLFLQFQHDGRVRTAEFVQEVVQR